MPWHANNPVTDSRSKRNYAAYRRAIAEVTQKHVAECCEVAPPTLSDFDQYMERACLALAAAGLKVVRQDEITISPEDKRYMLRRERRLIDRELEEMGETRPGDLT